MKNILAVAEQRDGSLRRSALEVITAARDLADELGGEVHAVLPGGAGTATMAAEAGRFGADRVLLAEHESLERGAPEAIASVAAQAAGRGYFAILLSASSLGKDVAPRLAARLDVPLATDATELRMDSSELVVVRPMYAGKAFATLVLEAEPRLVSVRPNVFVPKERQAAGEVERLTIDSDPADPRVRVRELRAAPDESVDVAEAPIIVSGGRGMQGPENWNLLEELRDALGSNVALGASRAVVDAGWRPHAEQVGQTGKTVAPQLYFAIGISGAIQHLAGMRTARTIVAINKDADAPIFRAADYGIVGDAFQVLPRLTEEIRGLKR